MEKFDSVVGRLSDMKGPNAVDRLDIFGRTLKGSRKKIVDVIYKEYTDHARVSVVNANSHFHFDRRERKGSEPPRYLGRPSFVFARE